MKKGDLVKIKSRLRDQYVSIYDDDQIYRLEAWIYLENYSPNLKVKQHHLSEQVAVVLEMKDIYKDGNGINIVWNRFVKVIMSSGLCGWIHRDLLTKIYEDD